MLYSSTLLFWICLDTGSNNSGFYELKAVLTHKGRSSTSGHYVGWVRLYDSKSIPSNSLRDSSSRLESIYSIILSFSNEVDSW